MIEQGIGERIYRSRQRNWWLSAAVLLASAGLAAILARRLLLGEAGLSPMLLFIWVAIAVVGFTIGCWLYWRTVDELEVKDNLWGGIAGLYTYMMGFPAWWLLWRGGAAPAPNAWAIYLASLGIATAVYLVRRATAHI